MTTTRGIPDDATASEARPSETHDSGPVPDASLPTAADLADPLRRPLIPGRQTPRSLIWRLSFGITGGAFLAAGVALGPIPVVPGFPLVVVGLLMLAASSELARGLINRAETRLPNPVRRTLRRLMHGRHGTQNSSIAADLADKAGRVPTHGPHRSRP